MGSKRGKQSFGVHELYRPTNTSAEIDIIAVHGLNGDAIKTWSSSDVCWLSHPDFLPKYLPRARILSWSYNANVASLKGKSTSQHRILQHAQTLISQLCADRELEDATERPIIFLCHSLGGIVVKRALAYSDSRKGAKISFLRSIYTCTYGILFLGTPHHGFSKSNLTAITRKLASITLPVTILATAPNLLTALQEGSETLQDINDQFCPLMSRFRIFFFWEQKRTKPTRLHLTKPVYIVNEASAAPILDNTERCGIAADHSGICKFASPQSQGFRDVVAALKRYCRSAPDVISARVERERVAILHIRQEEDAELVSMSVLGHRISFDPAIRMLLQPPQALPGAAQRALQPIDRSLLEISGEQIFGPRPAQESQAT